MDYHLYMGDFRRAVDLKKLNENTEAQAIFRKLCKKKHKASCLVIGEEVGWYPGLAIMQGASLAGVSQFVLTYDEPDSLLVFVRQKVSGEWYVPVKQRVISQDHSDWNLIYVEFKDLKPKANYQLVVVNNQGQLLDYRDFSAWDDSSLKTRFAALSCMRDDYKGTEEIWQDLYRKDPELLVMIGDNSYVDLNVRDKLFEVSAETIWNRHMQTRNKLEVFRWRKLVPVLATWDDHDYGKNDGDKDFSQREMSEQIFQWFFPSGTELKRVNPGPGVAFSVKLRGLNFILTDNRSFRWPRDTSKVQGWHFGKKQNQWVMQQLSQEHLNWLVSGDQFFGSYHPFDSFQGQHPKDFSNFVSQLKNEKAPVVFLSGDRHMSEVMAIPSQYLGFSTFEFTSSPMHSSVYPGASFKHVNTLRKNSVDGQWNYLLFDVEREGQGSYKIQVEARGRDEKLFFRQNMGLKL